MAKIVVMYSKPEDVEHFKRHYRDVHVPLCRQMPGIGDISYGYPVMGADGAEPPFFCVFTATFDSMDAIQTAFGSPAGKAVVADIPNYSPDHPPTILLMESTES